MSALNSRTLPKPLIIKLIAGQIDVPDNVARTLFSITLPANTAYQFNTQRQLDFEAMTALASITSININAYVGGVVAPAGSPLYWRYADDTNYVQPESAYTTLAGIIYNSGVEDILVEFKAIINTSAGLTGFSDTSIAFWEVPVAGYKVLP